MVGLTKSDEWVVSFHLRTPNGGHYWAKQETGEWVLARSFSTETRGVRHLEGKRAGRNVLNAFRSLGRTLQSELNGLHTDDELVMSKVLEFADRFGSLDGRVELGRGHTLGEWIEEAKDFALMCEVADAIMTADIAAYERLQSRYVERRDGMHFRRSKLGRTWRFAPRAVDWQEARNHVGVNLFQHAHSSGHRARAWSLVSFVVNKKLDGGLSLRLNPIRLNKPTIEPNGVLATAYVRLWLDIVQVSEEALVLPQTCKNCEEPIRGTLRREYCSDKCRAAFNRRIAAQRTSV
jgi:hypothetical protein